MYEKIHESFTYCMFVFLSTENVYNIPIENAKKYKTHYKQLNMYGQRFSIKCAVK